MTNSNLPAAVVGNLAVVAGAQQYVSFMIGDQSFGIPVLQVHDVLGPQRITRIPLSPPEIAGSLNLRGRIVTAIQARCRLGLDPLPADAETMSIVVEHGGELYSLIVDSVGEVLTLEARDFESHPPTMAPVIRDVSNGIYRLNDSLLIVLEVPRFLDFVRAEAA
ncbi:MAG: chemotaxis protein CheW [Alphaproteobacteria bacterium]|nr:chemotaxis protein CheW [Alphaproteobacteria bacterium]